MREFLLEIQPHPTSGGDQKHRHNRPFFLSSPHVTYKCSLSNNKGLHLLTCELAESLYICKANMCCSTPRFHSTAIIQTILWRSEVIRCTATYCSLPTTRSKANLIVHGYSSFSSSYSSQEANKHFYCSTFAHYNARLRTSCYTLVFEMPGCNCLPTPWLLIHQATIVLIHLGCKDTMLYSSYSLIFNISGYSCPAAPLVVLLPFTRQENQLRRKATVVLLHHPLDYR